MAMMGTECGSKRIAEAFHKEGRSAALMPYMMGGFPDLGTSIDIGRAYIQAGADLIELGVPFSDPLADGPVIQAAGKHALDAGMTVNLVLQVAAALARRVPVIVMCYVNLVLAYGQRRFVEALADIGVAGLLVPDQPAEEADDLLQHCDRLGVALVPLVAPTTTDERLALIAPKARGFIYAVSVTGVTGERGALPSGVEKLVTRVRKHSDLPVALGFGIATGDQARQVAQFADGVIVGSRLVRAAAEADTAERAVAGTAKLLSEIATALTESPR